MKMAWAWAGAFGVALGLACSPASVTTGGCKSSAECFSRKVCVNELCQDPGSIACDDNATCEPFQATCVSGFCSYVDTGDAGFVEDGGGDSDAAGVPTGDGVIAIDNELPVDFGSPLFGTAVRRVVTLRNVGEGGLHIFRVSRASGTSDEFAVNPEGTAADTILLPDRTLDIVVNYTLADGSADIGELIVMSDARDCAHFCDDPTTVRVPLYSEFKGERNLQVDPSSHDFGFVPTGSSSLYAPFTLSNQGSLSKVLTVSAVRLEGVDIAEFDLLLDPVPPYFLSPAVEQTVRVRYAPQATAFHTAELVIESNSDDPARQLVRITLSGRSVPSASLSALSAIDFGEVLVGESVERTFSVYNGGGMGATVLSPSRFDDGAQGFSHSSPSLPLTVPPGQGADFTLRFVPGSEGAHSDIFYLDHDASGSPIAVQLTGRGKLPPQGYSQMRIEQRFSRATSTAGCGFQVNYQNVDLELSVGGLVCDKNAGGCASDVCNCNLGRYGSAVWSCNNCGGVTASSEQITMVNAGSDGSFDVRAYYFDACTAGYFGVSGAALQAVCSFPGTREACFPYSVFPVLYPDSVHISETQCMYYVPSLAGGCSATAPTQVRTIIYLSSGTQADQTLHFCTDLSSQGQREQVARVERSEGLLNVTGPLGSTRQISASDPCGD